MKLIDTHCHLSAEEYENERSFIINDLSTFNVEAVINPATNIKDSIENIELSKKYSNIYASIGIHPENVSDIKEGDFEILENLLKDEKVVAIGEIGLDYYRVDDNKDLQKEVFKTQLDLARKMNLPVVIHSRNSTEDVIKILHDYRDLKVQIHCFSETFDILDIYMDMGFMISIGGVVTFNNGINEQMAAKNVPIDRLMLETDGPYLTPEPFRGKRNDPRYIIEVARKISEIRDMKLEKLSRATTKNAKEFFNI